MLLEFIEASALCQNSEVSLAALKSFQEILQIRNETKSDDWKLLFGHQRPDIITPSKDEGSDQTGNKQDVLTADESDLNDIGMDDDSLWTNAWRVWLTIGTAATMPPETSEKSNLYIPTQHFLTALMQIFPALYAHIKCKFFSADLQKLSTVLQRALAVPVHSDSTPFILPIGEVTLTPLQEAILAAVKVLQIVSAEINY